MTVPEGGAPRLPLFKTAMPFIMATVFIDVIGIGIIAPVTPSLIAEIAGKSIGEAALYGGWLVGVFAFLQFLAGPAVGSLSDARGRRPILLVTMLLQGFSYLLMGLAGSIFWLFVARCVSGVTSATNSVANAYVVDITPGAERSRRFGLLGACFSAGFIVGPALGGLLGTFGPRVPFYAAAALAFANTLYGFFFLPETLRKDLRRPFDWARSNPLGATLYMRRFGSVLDLILPMMVLLGAGGALAVIWPYYTMEQFHWNEMQVGLSVGVFGIMNVVVQTFVLRISLHALGERRVLYLSLAALVVCYLGFAFAPVGWVALASIVAWALGSMNGPILSSILSQQVPPDSQGALQGALSSARSLMGMVTPVAMTAVFSYFTAPGAPVRFPGAAYLASAMIAVVGAVLLIVALHRHGIGAPRAKSAAAAEAA